MCTNEYILNHATIEDNDNWIMMIIIIIIIITTRNRQNINFT